MKVQLNIKHLTGPQKGIGRAVVRFIGLETKTLYQQPFDGWINPSDPEDVGSLANIEFREDVAFHSATSNGPFDFNIVSIPDDAETHFYA